MRLRSPASDLHLHTIHLLGQGWSLGESSVDEAASPSENAPSAVEAQQDADSVPPMKQIKTLKLRKSSNL